MTLEDAARLAQRYGVAYTTAVYRLKNTSAITDRELQHLLAQEKVAAQYTQILDPAEEPAKAHETAIAQRKHPGDRSLVAEVIHLAIEAYRRELISSGKLRDLGRMLGMPAGDLVELAEAASA